MASGRIRFQIHQFFLLFSAAPHSNTALISACMQNVWRNKIKNKMPHTQRGFGLSTQYFSCIEWIKYSVLSISQWHSHNIYRLLCSASSMSLLPSPSQILISSYVLFIAVKESGTQSLYLPMSCLPAHQCGMASRIWGQLRDVGRPNCRRFAPLRLQDDLSLSSSGWGKSPAGTQVVHTCFATSCCWWETRNGNWSGSILICRHLFAHLGNRREAERRQLWAVHDDVTDCQLRPAVTKADPICCDHVSLEGLWTGTPRVGETTSKAPALYSYPFLCSAPYLDFINWGTVCCPFKLGFPRKRLANDRISKDNRPATTFWVRWQVVAESKSYCNGDRWLAHTVMRLSSVMNFWWVWKRLNKDDMYRVPKDHYDFRHKR